MQRFSTRGWFCSQGTFGNVWKRFRLSQSKGEGATGIHWVEASNDVKHPTKCPGLLPHNKEASGPKCQQW